MHQFTNTEVSDLIVTDFIYLDLKYSEEYQKTFSGYLYFIT